MSGRARLGDADDHKQTVQVLALPPVRASRYGVPFRFSTDLPICYLLRVR